MLAAYTIGLHALYLIKKSLNSFLPIWINHITNPKDSKCLNLLVKLICKSCHFFINVIQSWIKLLVITCFNDLSDWACALFLGLIHNEKRTRFKFSHACFTLSDSKGVGSTSLDREKTRSQIAKGALIEEPILFLKWKLDRYEIPSLSLSQPALIANVIYTDQNSAWVNLNTEAISPRHNCTTMDFASLIWVCIRPFGHIHCTILMSHTYYLI